MLIGQHSKQCLLETPMSKPLGPLVRYRRCLGASERKEDFIAVQMTLARPRLDAERWPIAVFVGDCFSRLQ